MTRHANKLAELKAKAKADAKVGKAIDAYDKNGKFVLIRCIMCAHCLHLGIQSTYG